MSAEIPAGTLVEDRDGRLYIVTFAPAAGSLEGYWVYCDLDGAEVLNQHCTDKGRPATLWLSRDGGVAWVQGKTVNCVWPNLTESRWTPDEADLASAREFVAGR